MKGVLGLWVGLALGAAAGAQMWSPGPDQPAEARIELVQRLGQQVDLSAEFRDESGNPVRLGDYFRDKPVVLLLVWYKCQGVCSLVFDGALRLFNEAKPTIGRDFRVVTVSVHPEETPEDALMKKADTIKFYERSDADVAWHFLTAPAGTVSRLAESVGYSYRYREKEDTIDHPAGLIVLTPQGKVSGYLFGVNYDPARFQEALGTAAGNRIGRRVTPPENNLLCFMVYDPVTGRYTLLVGNILKVTGIATVLIVALSILVMSIRSGRRAKNRGPGLANSRAR